MITAARTASAPPIQSVRLESGICTPFHLVQRPLRATAFQSSSTLNLGEQRRGRRRSAARAEGPRGLLDLAILRLTFHRLDDGNRHRRGRHRDGWRCDGHRLNIRHGGDLLCREGVHLSNRLPGQPHQAFHGCSSTRHGSDDCIARRGWPSDDADRRLLRCGAGAGRRYRVGVRLRKVDGLAAGSRKRYGRESAEGGEGDDDGDNDEPLFYRRVVTTPVSKLGDSVLEASNQVIEDPIHDPALDFLPTRRQTASPTVAALRCGLSPSSLGCSGGSLTPSRSLPRCLSCSVRVAPHWPHDRTDDPEERQKDAEKEQPPVPISERHDSGGAWHSRSEAPAKGSTVVASAHGSVSRANRPSESVDEARARLRADNPRDHRLSGCPLACHPLGGLVIARRPRAQLDITPVIVNCAASPRVSIRREHALTHQPRTGGCDR